MNVHDLTLRTPTLDDAFLEMTGSRIERDEAEEDPVMTAIPRTTRVAARPAGFVHDLTSIARRGPRAAPRDVEAVAGFNPVTYILEAPSLIASRIRT